MSSQISQGRELRPCDLCGSFETRPRYEVDGYHIVECRRCRLCYVAERVTDEELVAYYGAAYYNGAQDKGYADYLGHREARKAHFRSLMPTLRRYLQRDDVRVLDVGCAAGFFLEVATEAGWQAQGVEISPYMSAYAREAGLDVRTGSLEEADLSGPEFNLITMWDVIEHVSNPFDTLRMANSLLAADGVIAIATGDVSGATARVYGARWGLLAPPGHLFYFSRKTLFAMLGRAGFRPLGWQSDGSFLINEIDNGAPSRGLRSAVYALHRNRLVNAGLRRLGLGSIMTVYAQKDVETA